MSDVDYEPPYLYPGYRSNELRAPQHEPVRLPGKASCIWSDAWQNWSGARARLLEIDR